MRRPKAPKQDVGAGEAAEGRGANPAVHSDQGITPRLVLHDRPVEALFDEARGL